MLILVTMEFHFLETLLFPLTLEKQKCIKEVKLLSVGYLWKVGTCLT